MARRLLAASAALTLSAAPALAQSCANDPAAFPAWLDGVRMEALAGEIAPAAVAALEGVAYDPTIVERDRGQTVFSQTFLEFSDRVVSSFRLRRGGELLAQHAALFARIEQEFGVPGPVIVALWAMESDFGAGTGNVPILRSVATLAFDCRRPDEFRPQLLDALRIIDRGDLSQAQLIGAWAGELGQTQFRPSEYLRSGLDYDGDGRVDLLNSVPDVLASTANLLRFHGWRPGEPWLEEVTLTAELPWEETGVYRQRPRTDWAGWGVVRRDGSPLPADALPAALILPMGRDGPAFIAYANIHALLEWNESLVNSLTAAYLATRLAGAPQVRRGGSVASLDIDRIRELQSLLAEQGYDVGGIDGVIGARTREAVRDMQLRLGLAADGYPTAAFLTILRGGEAFGLSALELVELQTLLARLGYDIGAVDGVIGPRTRAAITAAQERFGLPADGNPTSELLARLRAL